MATFTERIAEADNLYGLTNTIGRHTYQVLLDMAKRLDAFDQPTNESDGEPACCWSPRLEPYFSAVEEMAWRLTRDQLAYILGTRVRFVPQERLDAELAVANTTIDSLQEQLEGAWADANEHADKANKRIKELEEKLRYAEYALGVMKDADDFDADANAAGQRRMKMLEERVTAKTDEINALKRQIRELEDDATLGKLIRELKPGPEDYQLHLLVRVAENGSKRCRITRSIRSPKACWESGAEFDSVEKAIADYKAIADHMRKD